MPTILKEYKQFLRTNFKELRLKKPLLYSWDFGLRFDLQIDKNDTEEYFQEVTKRASTIFRDVFNDSDNIFLVYMDYKYRRQKIRVSNFTFKQIKNLLHTEITYSKRLRLYEAQDRFDVRNMAIIKLTTERISYKNILTAIANNDFSSRKPRLDDNSIFTNKEVYFINIDTKLIFHMYDDRGLELIAADKESLRPIYQKYNEWILNYDREKIETLFAQ
ncbi:hypothetical protein D3C87_1372190 [compost metagenome]